MALEEIKPGLTGQAERAVSPQDLASAYGNPGVEVLSSMTLMTLLEQASIAAIMDRLDQDREMCVGARMEMDHLAPTPPGYTVTAKAELSQVEGRKLVFTVTAHDGRDTVAKAVHVRYVVDKGRFLEQVAAKAEAV